MTLFNQAPDSQAEFSRSPERGVEFEIAYSRAGDQGQITAGVDYLSALEAQAVEAMKPPAEPSTEVITRDPLVQKIYDLHDDDLLGSEFAKAA